MSPARILTVGPDDDDIRLDRWFRRHFPALGHGHLEKLLRTGQIRVDGGRARASMRIAAGRAVRIPPGLDDKFARPGIRAPVSPSDAELLRSRVLYRDAGTIAIDKPAGLAVQGGSKVKSSVDAMLDALRFDADERPRLVHRLDKDTSGVLALARSRKAAAALVAAFREGRVEKEYWALVVGVPPRESGVVDLPLAKAPAPGGGES
ncbi:MAG: RluA family pseudouridine synthase, partial [Defluviicoccus sp.]|nr:RluA family pseudouridine synthase [Defluviicoccus sp.]